MTGVIAYQTKQFKRAIDLIGRAIGISQNSPDAYYNRATVLAELNRYGEAIEDFARAIVLNPAFAQAYYNRGTALIKLKQYKEAVEDFNHAIALNSGYAEAYHNRANALRELNRYGEAIEDFDRAIALKPDFSEAHYNRGTALSELNQYDAAVKAFGQAIALKPAYADAYNNRANALRELKRFDEAMQDFGRTIALHSEDTFACGQRLHTKMHLCDWSDIEQQLAQIKTNIAQDKKSIPPFPLLALADSLPLQKLAAQRWVQDRCPTSSLPITAKYPRHSKIRLGYYSADYHSHATSYLIAELFERHDKSRFELFAFSFGPEKTDAMRKRVAAAFDKFIDASALADQAVAQASRNLEVDIAIDLNGFSKGCRTGIFAARAAPIQVSYLGYPGTMGAQYIDYLVADPTLIPENSRQHYSENIVYLPNSYQVNDSKRCIADRTFSREESGLPQAGFVFCCFNNSYKITPYVFSSWMRILRQVESSTLWLLEDSPQASANLRKQAQQCGVNAERLIFAKRKPPPEHLARHRMAGLFLDTLPYNAHTTASDALWAGLPVLTLMGESFASRVAASLLNAVGLPELITTSQAQYEALAVDLATHPLKLEAIKEKLEHNRLVAPLFDTALFTKHIEAAYSTMYERYQADLRPDHITVQ